MMEHGSIAQKDIQINKTVFCYFSLLKMFINTLNMFVYAIICTKRQLQLQFYFRTGCCVSSPGWYWQRLYKAQLGFSVVIPLSSPSNWTASIALSPKDANRYSNDIQLFSYFS